MALVISTPSDPFTFTYTEPVSGGTDQHFEYDFTFSHQDSEILQLTYIATSTNFTNLDRQGANPATVELFVKDQVPGGSVDDFASIDVTHSMVTVGFDLPFDYYDRLGAGEVASIRASMTVNDLNEDESDTLLVRLDITGRNDNPTAADDAVTVSDKTVSFTKDVVQNDDDIDIGDTLAVVGVGTPGAAVAGAGTVLPPEYVAQAPGTASFDASGVAVEFNSYFAFLAAGESVTFVVPYSMSDGHGGTAAADIVYRINGTATKTFKGSKAADQLLGEDDFDKLLGDDGRDTMFGRAGNDRLLGGKGKDVLVGGLGADDLSGESGNDVFRFSSIADSGKKAAARDMILDFGGKDRVDLSPIDPVAGGLDDAFAWRGQKGFSGKGPEVFYAKLDKDVVVYADADGNGKADFAIGFHDIGGLSKGDFLL